MFQLYVNVQDIDPQFHDLIADIFIDLILDPSESFNPVGTYGMRSGGSITLQFKVMCNADYYSLDCATFCVDTDDDTGHFNCSSTGEKLCLPGWSEPTTNCLTRKPILIKCQHCLLINVVSIIVKIGIYALYKLK